MTTRAKTPAADKTLDVTNVMQEATAKVETLVADTQKAVTEQFEKFSKGLEGLTTFGQENVDAIVKSSEIAAKAAEGIGTEISAYSKKSFEDSVAAAQDFASAKTLTELFEKQTSFAQSAFEGFVSQATKMNEIYVAAAKDITRPDRRPRDRRDRGAEDLQPLRVKAVRPTRALLLPGGPHRLSSSDRNPGDLRVVGVFSLPPAGGVPPGDRSKTLWRVPAFALTMG